MKRNGFTLIELLAVIVITGLIIAITTPKVLEILETSKRETFKLDVAGVVRNLDNQIYNLEIKGKNYQGVYTIENGIIKEVNNFNYSIDKNYNGTITITEDKEIAVTIHSDKFCATKRINDPDYTISNYTGVECITPTPESCFEFDSETGTILDYYFDYGYYDEPSTATTLCGFNPVIPDKINGVDVEVIGDSAFWDNGIASVILPKNLKIIEEGAFFSNFLTEITIPSGVERIEAYAFFGNSLTKLVIPYSVLFIGGGAFGWNQIEKLTVPELIYMEEKVFNTNKLPDSQAFIYRRNLDGTIDNSSLISYGGFRRENVVIPDNVTNIGLLAFDNVDLLSIIIPNSVISIGEAAFTNNYLTSLTIPNSVTSIGEDAFSSNNLTSITIPNSVTSIGEDAFLGNNLTSVTIPSSVTSIGDYAFKYNSLTSVTIPDSVTSIGKGAFYKSEYSNNTLNSIIYSGTTAHDWNNIINGTTGETGFATGTVANSYGNVIISAN